MGIKKGMRPRPNTSLRIGPMNKEKATKLEKHLNKEHPSTRGKTKVVKNYHHHSY